MSTHEENIATLGWDPNDPHGIHADHAGNIDHDQPHGHPVLSWQLQLGVLALLLFFTFTTVLFFNAENWIESAFEIHLPNWVNIVGAMSIATVKAILVCMFFMQLKYDKLLNTFAMLFCLFCVGLFLGITMLDLETRDAVEPWRKGEVVVGGTGTGLDSPSVNAGMPFDTTPSPLISTGGIGLVDYNRQQAIKKAGSEEAFWAYYYKKGADHQHAQDTSNYYAKLGYDQHINLPDANHAAPRTGLTPGLFDAIDPATKAKSSQKTTSKNDH